MDLMEGLISRNSSGCAPICWKGIKADAARQQHIADMKSLAAREGQTWQQVENILDTNRKIASVYDEATALLEKLKQLSEFQDTRDIFQQRMNRLAEKYATRHSLIERWWKRGWL
jgi:hypothetical protein